MYTKQRRMTSSIIITKQQQHTHEQHHHRQLTKGVTATTAAEQQDKHSNVEHHHNNNEQTEMKEHQLSADNFKEHPSSTSSTSKSSSSYNFTLYPISENTKGALAVVLYGSVSLCQTIFNKKVMTTYNFEASNLLLFCQMVVSLVILHFLKYMRVLNIQTSIDFNIIKKLAPLSFCYIINVLLGLDSLKALNIPMYSALKRLVAVIILVMEYFILKKISPTRVILSVCVMVLGAIVAGVTDLSFNAFGYTLVLTSCFFQATYLVFVKKTARDMSTNDPAFLWYFTLSIFIGFLLNFCIFFCTSVNSALTTSVTGQIKNIASTIIGAMVFKDIIIHPINILGLFINMVGSIWYSALKLSG
ncbi:hypothetical protein SAMD00019534_060560, partial [Acytostelium subglobosum LB1]|uniref:hypothetical protein n=1 Tax=Acytostelium subglobosum LB1 TaxID=1410327 RepID=UPI000644F940